MVNYVNKSLASCVKKYEKPASKEMSLLATMEGYLNVLIYCREIGCRWDKWVPTTAATNGHFEIIVYCTENNCPLDSDMFLHAATGGCIKILEHYKGNENIKAWNSWTCTHAAAGGHLDMLKYLRENDPKDQCPWDEETCLAAAYSRKC